ncbi:MAG: hydroxylamine reductase [Spirochaetales bacterium]|nr:hydroxylamine reductase [Spirochaetales bacterium]
MFCFQCQEAAGNTGCTVRGVCGKEESTANLQDVLVYAVRGLALAVETLDNSITDDAPETIDFEMTVVESGRAIFHTLFATITNASFDDERLAAMIGRVLRLKETAAATIRRLAPAVDLHRTVTWSAAAGDMAALYAMIPEASVLAETNEDARALRELTIYGVKGIAAYGDHAAVLGYEDPALYREVIRILAGTVTAGTAKELTQLVLDAGNAAVTVMALLDRANTETYGSPEITKVNIGVGTRPGILISGHDLKDLHELLEQTTDSGVDIYTHGEMLPAHYYPAFKKYPHFVGNYGNSWWLQDKEFASFNGPILMTTNCLVPPKDTYKKRLFTTGAVAFPGITHIPERGDTPGAHKDFTEIIEAAKSCAPPTELESGTITGGFAHAQVTALADTVVDAVKSGAIKKFVVMAGCDGRQKGRSYFTEMAQALPGDAVILTAGCAKYRYNKLDLGDIGGIPRVLDAGQCNDSYSLAVIALKLKEIFALDDINDLPIEFDIAWYEQKAVAVLLALLALGFKGVRIGPTLPAFLSPGVAQVLVETFGLAVTTTVEEDLAAIVG